MVFSISILFFLWFVLFGAAIGSFLNVVIYRLPTKQSLSFPPSHCPNCKHPIRWYDNIPVFGWLRLQGKCRDCKTPISVRYPLIEGICSLYFGSVAICVFLTRPNHPIEEVIGLTAYLLLYWTTVLAAGMIEWDKRAVPANLFVPVLFVSLIISWQCAFLHPIPSYCVTNVEDTELFSRSLASNGSEVSSGSGSSSRVPMQWVSTSQPWRGGIDAIIGLAAGLGIALLSIPLISKSSRLGWFFTLAATGAALGWQCVSVYAVLVLFITTCSGFFKCRLLPILTLCFIAGIGIVLLIFL